MLLSTGDTTIQKWKGFDPVIDMLFGACSVEFERLSTALYNSRSRILEKSCTDPFA